MTIKFRLIFLGLLVMLVVAGWSPAEAQEIGRIVEVIGGVDLLKGGKLPATPVREGDQVGKGDVIRTKSNGKVKIALADDSVLTIAPSSRVALHEFTYAPEQGQRRAAIKIFYGLIHTLVTKIFKRDEPDFMVETNTATIGVRGTDYYTLVAPDASDIYNHTGRTEVRNIFPEIAGKVILEGLAYTRVGMNLAPTVPLPITLDDIKWLDGQMAPKMTQAPDTGSKPQLLAQVAGATVQQTKVQVAALTTFNQQQTNVVQNLQSAIYVPPQPAQPPLPSSILATPFHFMITWTSASDPDLHLTGPEAAGKRFHIYFMSQGDLGNSPYAYLHHDQISMSGSEVITVNKFITGDLYRASVYNYGDPSPTSTNLSTSSGVEMKLFTGGTVTKVASGSVVNGGTLIATLRPPTGVAGNTWRAVEINPSTGQINKVNQILNSSNSSAVQ